MTSEVGWVQFLLAVDFPMGQCIAARLPLSSSPFLTLLLCLTVLVVSLVLLLASELIFLPTSFGLFPSLHFGPLFLSFPFLFLFLSFLQNRRLGADHTNWQTNYKEQPTTTAQWKRGKIMFKSYTYHLVGCIIHMTPLYRLDSISNVRQSQCSAPQRTPKPEWDEMRTKPTQSTRSNTNPYRHHHNTKDKKANNHIISWKTELEFHSNSIVDWLSFSVGSNSQHRPILQRRIFTPITLVHSRSEYCILPCRCLVVIAIVPPVSLVLVLMVVTAVMWRPLFALANSHVRVTTTQKTWHPLLPHLIVHRRWRSWELQPLLQASRNGVNWPSYASQSNSKQRQRHRSDMTVKEQSPKWQWHARIAWQNEWINKKNQNYTRDSQ